LTPLQLEWIGRRIDTKSDREASRQLGIDKDTPGRWKADGVPLDEIVRTAKQDGVILVQRRIRADLNWAYDVKRSGLTARAESIRQGAASEILDRGLGRALQKIAPTDPTGDKEFSGFSDNERIKRIEALLRLKEEAEG